MGRILDWLRFRILRQEDSRKPVPGVRVTGAHVRPKPPRPPTPSRTARPGRPEGLKFRPELEGRIEDGGPGKNVLVRNRYVREDTGTHEKLVIIDEASLDDDGDKGFDPYNTGQFDRSQTWSRRPK